MKFFGKTDVGSVRTNNEDAFSVNATEKGGLFIVADGMGGHNAGEVASAMAIQTIEMEMAVSSVDNVVLNLRSAIRSASKRIHRHAMTKQELSGMGTTVDVCWIEGMEAIIAHVGDSRVYLFREGKLHQITIDHSLVEEMVISKQISREEAKVHPMRNVITRALGDENVQVDIMEVELQDQDRFLLCSDGLTGMVSDEKIEAIMLEDTPEHIVDTLIKTANDNGGEDNITAVVVFIEKRDEE